MPFKKGDPRPPGAGRKKGSKDKLTQEARTLARSMLTEEYRDALKVRLLEGKAGIIESKVWEYAFGKPADTVNLNVPSKIVHIHEHYWGESTQA